MVNKNNLLISGIVVLVVVLVVFFLFFKGENGGDDLKRDISGDVVTNDISIPHDSMSFFITSVGPGVGGDLGGLFGADTYCETLAENSGVRGKVWKAYLSAEDVNARDRIGSGPWYNYDGVMIAENVNGLHGENNLNKETALSEKGEIINGRGDSPNRHDILTGSQLDGTIFVNGEDTTCNDWTSSGEGSARLGHHDRIGGGEYPESWNSAHGSRGCSQENLQSTGGDGLFYCFAIGDSSN